MSALFHIFVAVIVTEKPQTICNAGCVTKIIGKVRKAFWIHCTFATGDY